jgi:hypothetical protein
MATALSHNSPPYQAAQYGLLAVSSLHRYGLQRQAAQYKIAAIRALSESTTKTDLTFSEASLLVATCMLLCSFEVSRADPKLLNGFSQGHWSTS